MSVAHLAIIKDTQPTRTYENHYACGARRQPDDLWSASQKYVNCPECCAAAGIPVPVPYDFGRATVKPTTNHVSDERAEQVSDERGKQLSINRVGTRQQGVLREYLPSHPAFQLNGSDLIVHDPTAAMEVLHKTAETEKFDRKDRQMALIYLARRIEAATKGTS